MSARSVESAGDDATITRQQWKWTFLAAMASYLDAGVIVALAAGLARFSTDLGLSAVGIGALTAIGPAAVGCAIGSVVGGRLGDKLGRKRIYKWDLLVYALGVLLVVFAVHPAMLFVGTFVVAVAVGADVPTSLALVGEFAPAKRRGRLLGLTQVAWGIGPVVVLVLALVLSPLGMLGTRIVFLHLCVAALVTWALRRGMVESTRWRAAVRQVPQARGRLSELFRGANLRALVWTGTIYTFWGLAAGTTGAFLPYFVETLGAGTQAAGVALSCAGYLISILTLVFVFMPLVDRSYATRRAMWGIGAFLQIAAYGIYLVIPFTAATVVTSIVLAFFGAMLAGDPTYRVFSQELFPTVLRGTAQGLTFGFARVVLGVWSFFVPILASVQIGPVAMLLTAFLVVSGVVGFAFMPDTVGKSLEQIESERSPGGAVAPVRPPVVSGQEENP